MKTKFIFVVLLVFIATSSEGREPWRPENFCAVHSTIDMSNDRTKIVGDFVGKHLDSLKKRYGLKWINNFKIAWPGEELIVHYSVMVVCPNGDAGELEAECSKCQEKVSNRIKDAMISIKDVETGKVVRSINVRNIVTKMGIEKTKKSGPTKINNRHYWRHMTDYFLGLSVDFLDNNRYSNERLYKIESNLVGLLNRDEVTKSNPDSGYGYIMYKTPETKKEIALMLVFKARSLISRWEFDFGHRDIDNPFTLQLASVYLDYASLYDPDSFEMALARSRLLNKLGNQEGALAALESIRGKTNDPNAETRLAVFAEGLKSRIKRKKDKEKEKNSEKR